MGSDILGAVSKADDRRPVYVRCTLLCSEMTIHWVMYKCDDRLLAKVPVTSRDLTFSPFLNECESTEYAYLARCTHILRVDLCHVVFQHGF